MIDVNSRWSDFLAALIGPRAKFVGGAFGSSLTVGKALKEPLKSNTIVFEKCALQSGRYRQGMRGTQVIPTFYYRVGPSLLPKSKEVCVYLLFLDEKEELVRASAGVSSSLWGVCCVKTRERLSSGFLGLNRKGTLVPELFFADGDLALPPTLGKVPLKLLIGVVDIEDGTELARAFYPIEYSTMGNLLQDGRGLNEAVLDLSVLIIEGGGKVTSAQYEILREGCVGDSSSVDYRSLQQMIGERMKLLSAVKQCEIDELIERASAVVKKIIPGDKISAFFGGHFCKLAMALKNPTPLQRERLMVIAQKLGVDQEERKAYLASLKVGLDDIHRVALDLFSTVINADGVVSSREVKFVRSWFEDMAKKYSEDTFEFLELTKSHLEEALTRRPDVDGCCRYLARTVEVSDRAAILRTCYEIAMADSRLDASEEELLVQIAERLDVPTSEAGELSHLFGKGLDTLLCVLELEAGASLDDVKKAFRTKAMALHPDKQGDISEQEKRAFGHRFAELKEAYDELCRLLEE